MGYLDKDGLAYLWQKIKAALAGKQDAITPGDGLSQDGDTINVDNPVRGIYTQSEFDALPEAQKDRGTYFVDKQAVSWWSPKMTSNNAPAPYVVSASSDMPSYGSSGPYAAFDDNQNTYWSNNETYGEPWIAIDFGAEKEIFGLQMWARTTQPNQLPHTFVLQGSHNETDWIDIYTATDLPPDTAGTVRDFVFKTSETYRYYRIANMRSYYRFDSDSTVDTYIGIANIRFADKITGKEIIYSNGEAVQIPAGATIDQVNAAIDEKLKGVTAQEVYSTEEQRIGTWIDGKPLYRKVYSLTTPSAIPSSATTPWFYLPDNISLVRYEGWVDLGGNGYRPLNLPTASGSYTMVFCNYENYMMIQCDTAMNPVLASKPAIVILEYTKTTDAAAITLSAQSDATIKLSTSTLDLTNIPSAPVTAAGAGVEIAKMEEV